mmetsp:Transcript_31642/g.73870  ORF Transcript_31642/g.73870 Transcript_31642/m.73870 type:complete len:230 (-) Transcript_31642:615-1304(-)
MPKPPPGPGAPAGRISGTPPAGAAAAAAKPKRFKSYSTSCRRSRASIAFTSSALRCLPGVTFSKSARRLSKSRLRATRSTGPRHIGHKAPGFFSQSERQALQKLCRQGWTLVARWNTSWHTEQVAASNVSAKLPPVSSAAAGASDSAATLRRFTAGVELEEGAEEWKTKLMAASRPTFAAGSTSIKSLSRNLTEVALTTALLTSVPLRDLSSSMYPPSDSAFSFVTTNC